MFVVNPEYARFFLDDPAGHTAAGGRARAAGGGVHDYQEDRHHRGVRNGRSGVWRSCSCWWRRERWLWAAVSGWRSRALARLAPRQAVPAADAFARRWSGGNWWIGSARVPASAKDLPQTKTAADAGGISGSGNGAAVSGRPRRSWRWRSGWPAVVAVWQASLNVLLVPAAAMAGYMAPGQYLMFRIATAAARDRARPAERSGPDGGVRRIGTRASTSP